MALLLTTLIAAVGLTCGASSATQTRPNIVVIMTDDQTLESMRVMDNVNSEIAAEGMTFERSYVNFPLCCPSRATLLTGQYAHNHGVLDNEPPAGGYGVFQSAHGTDNLVTWLDGSGYLTGHVGKYFNGYGEDDPAFVPQGWDEWYGAVPSAQQVYDYRLNENGSLVRYGADAEDFKTDVLTGKAVEFIEEHAPADEPFFLDLAYTAPHRAGPNPSPQAPATTCSAAAKPAPRHAHAFDREPLPQPPSFNEADVTDKPFGIRERATVGERGTARLTRRYRCMLESLLAVDEGAGEVMDALERSGEVEDTVVLFTSDNGFFYGEHRVTDGKLRHYEPSTRVPLVIRGPGIPANSSTTEPVINADLAPTLLDAAAADPSHPLDGLSLLPLGGDPDLDLDRDLLLESRHYAAVRGDRYVYVEHGNGRSREMYDLDADPHELENLIGAEHRVRIQADLARRLDALRTCAGQSCSVSPR